MGVAFGECAPGFRSEPCDSILIMSGVFQSGNRANVVYCEGCSEPLFHEARTRAIYGEQAQLHLNVEQNRLLARFGDKRKNAPSG